VVVKIPVASGEAEADPAAHDLMPDVGQGERMVGMIQRALKH